jgi:hypothetical protein
MRFVYGCVLRISGVRRLRSSAAAVADQSGWKVVKVYEDAGISGAKGGDQRPGLDAMMKTVNAKEFDLVASWSVDRLGRSLADLLSILQGLHGKGGGLFHHQKGLDTTTSGGLKCLAYSLSSSGGSFASELTQASHVPEPRERSCDAAASRRRLRREYWS